MGNHVVMSAVCQCTMGAAPSSLMILPIHNVISGDMPGGNINDYVPFMNVLPFGTCNSVACPTTASLTAAALGVLTPGPCIPGTAAPWAPGAPTVLVDNMPALTPDSQAVCSYGGAISIKFAGQVTVQAG